MSNSLLHGIYHESGPEQHLRFKRALLRQHPNRPDYYIAQFDNISLREAYGWHTYPKKRFVNIEEL